MEQIATSVIIPTYNRASMLGNTLSAMARANVDFARLEVIVVDDGSSDNTAEVCSNTFPFSLRYHKQRNQGDAAARNYGAQTSRGEFLVFLDDDIYVTPDLLANFEKAHNGAEGIIVLGTLVEVGPEHSPQSEGPDTQQPFPSFVTVPFTECRSGLMAIGRQDFMRLGMLQPLEIQGSSIWCDVEFAYRADKVGFSFIRSLPAVAYHHDYVQRSLSTKRLRMHRVARESVLLFHRHPQLQHHLPMFLDKTPIVWRGDPWNLIARKFVRALASAPPVVRLLEAGYLSCSGSRRFTRLAATLERWIIGSYIYRGYRQGLRQYGPVGH